MHRALASSLFLAFSLSACSKDDTAEPAPPTVVSYELEADFGSETKFFEFPYPSDLRLTAKGTPDGNAFPNPLGKTLVAGLRGIVADRPGYPVVPGAYFKFSRALAPRVETDVIAADATSPILLVDCDESSPDRGRLVPTVAVTLPSDDYVPDNVIAIAPRPGFVLVGKRKYAFVITKSLKDAAGNALGAPAAFSSVMAGTSPGGTRGDAAVKSYAPLVSTLRDKLKIDPKDVAAATVFTTGDVVADFAELSNKVIAKYSVDIKDLKVDPDDGASHDRYCELLGTVTYPQFQRGKPPFDKDGLFEMDADGLPKKQRDEDAPITITIPKGEMPAGGWPLVVYFHGSGGVSGAIADRGRWSPQTSADGCPDKHLDKWLGKSGCNKKGEGPGFVVAPHGLAMAASALPVNPQRLPGAKETEYLNFANLAAFRDTFRQGVIEQRMYIEALRKLTIDPSIVAACTGLSLPAGETAHHFKETPLMAQGQSMGAMYANIIGTVEPRIKLLVPTGAGGYWSYFITKTKLYDDTAGLIAALLGTDRNLSFLHPTLQLLETAWEPSDPFVYMPRLARRPLPGHPVRSIYEPAGKDDSYFPTMVYDAVALSYGHPEGGASVWTTMQDALKLAGLDGLRPYPLSANLKSESGTPYTGAILQYEGDGVYDPHALYTQLDAVQYQYGCFYETFLKTGTPSILAPRALGAPCAP